MHKQTHRRKCVKAGCRAKKKPRRRLGRRLPKRCDRLLPDAVRGSVGRQQTRIRRVTSHSKGRRSAAVLRSRMLLLNTVLIKRARHNLIHAGHCAITPPLWRCGNAACWFVVWRVWRRPAAEQVTRRTLAAKALWR